MLRRLPPNTEGSPGEGGGRPRKGRARDQAEGGLSPWRHGERRGPGGASESGGSSRDNMAAGGIAAVHSRPVGLGSRHSRIVAEIRWHITFYVPEEEPLTYCSLHIVQSAIQQSLCLPRCRGEGGTVALWFPSRRSQGTRGIVVEEEEEAVRGLEE